jgi:hypothetical protein
LSGIIIPKLTKLDFSHFNDNKYLISGICQAQQFFEFHNIPNEEKLTLAAYNLEGESQLWCQVRRSKQGETTWTVLKEWQFTWHVPTKYVEFLLIRQILRRLET